MCGICGVAGGDPARGGELVQRMCGSMVHRGPDDEGSIHLDGVTLGMRRLSIIDIEGGHQPMSNEDSTVWVIQNGEIYNHRQLREQLLAAGHRFATKSDTEVLVHGYEEWGERMIERLNGMFAFALLDRRKASLLLARDRMGIKPLHYAIDGERFVFASELKALLQDTALRKGIDPVALDEYLEYEFVPSPRSIVRGVNKLRPGHTLSWSLADRRPAVRRYWAPELNLERAGGPGNLDEECGRLRDALREAVRKELISDVPVGVFLSGGIDSSAVTAMMTQLGGDVKSFSVGFAEPSFDESGHARDVARHLGTDHHELTLEPAALLGLIPRLSLLLDEPLGDASIIPTYLLSACTRRHGQAAIAGGADRSRGHRWRISRRRICIDRRPQPGAHDRHAALPRERHPGQAGPRLDDGVARGQGAGAEQRLRGVRDESPPAHEAERPADEIPPQAGPTRDPAGPHPRPSQKRFRHSGCGMVPRSAEGTDAVCPLPGSARRSRLVRAAGGPAAPGRPPLRPAGQPGAALDSFCL